jgi:hypothetical protein
MYRVGQANVFVNERGGSEIEVVEEGCEGGRCKVSLRHELEIYQK